MDYTSPYSEPIITPAPATAWYTDKNIIINILLILLFLSIIGVNLISLAGNALTSVTNYIAPPILYVLFTIVNIIGDFLKLVINSLANWSIFIIQLFAGAANTGINLLEAGSGSSGSNDFTYMKTFYQPSSSLSTAPFPVASSKMHGWCPIGNDSDGKRTCVKVDSQQDCASGKIYPTRDLCINPYTRV